MPADAPAVGPPRRASAFAGALALFMPMPPPTPLLAPAKHRSDGSWLVGRQPGTLVLVKGPGGAALQVGAAGVVRGAAGRRVPLGRARCGRARAAGAGRRRPRRCEAAFSTPLFSSSQVHAAGRTRVSLTPATTRTYIALLPPAATGVGWVLAAWAGLQGGGAGLRFAFRLADDGDGEAVAAMLAADKVVAAAPSGGGGGEPADARPPSPRSFVAAAAASLARDRDFEGLVQLATGMLPRVLEELGEPL